MKIGSKQWLDSEKRKAKVINYLCLDCGHKYGVPGGLAVCESCCESVCGILLVDGKVYRLHEGVDPEEEYED